MAAHIYENINDPWRIYGIPFRCPRLAQSNPCVAALFNERNPIAGIINEMVFGAGNEPGTLSVRVDHTAGPFVVSFHNSYGNFETHVYVTLENSSIKTKDKYPLRFFMSGDVVEKEALNKDGQKDGQKTIRHLEAHGYQAAPADKKTGQSPITFEYLDSKLNANGAYDVDYSIFMDMKANNPKQVPEYKYNLLSRIPVTISRDAATNELHIKLTNSHKEDLGDVYIKKDSLKIAQEYLPDRRGITFDKFINIRPEQVRKILEAQEEEMIAQLMQDISEGKVTPEEPPYDDELVFDEGNFNRPDENHEIIVENNDEITRLVKAKEEVAEPKATQKSAPDYLRLPNVAGVMPVTERTGVASFTAKPPYVQSSNTESLNM